MKNIDRKKRIILISGTLLLCICICAAAVLFFVQKGADDEVTYRTVSPERVSMKQTLTAAGQVTAGKEETIALETKKKFSACTAEEKERVIKGQPLVYYTDGSHTDAPADGIVTKIPDLSRGDIPSSSDYLSFRSTGDLFLSIHIPEDRINDMHKDDTAVIIINAQKEKEYKGRIIRINGISNGLISGGSEEDEDEDVDEDEDAAEEDPDAEGDEEEEEDLSEDYGEGEYEDEAGDDEGGSMAYYTVLISFPNDGTVRPGMSANSVITISERNDVLALPVEAVQFDENSEPFVNVVDGNKTRKQAVTLGESDAMNVEIKDGLRSDDRIRILHENRGN